MKTSGSVTSVWHKMKLISIYWQTAKGVEGMQILYSITVPQTLLTWLADPSSSGAVGGTGCFCNYAKFEFKSGCSVRCSSINWVTWSLHMIKSYILEGLYYYIQAVNRSSGILYILGVKHKNITNYSPLSKQV